MKSCLFVSLAACAAVAPAWADLGAAVRRASRQSRSSNSPPIASASSLVVHLRRVGVRPASGNSGLEQTTFYIGSVSVGTPPQDLQVMFDTASGHVLLPHRACSSAACVEHRRYSPWESATAVDVNADGEQVMKGNRLVKGKVVRQMASTTFTQADLGEGLATGILVRDQVCVGSLSEGQASVELAMLAATKLDDVPFRAMPHDGIIGLGLNGLSSSPMCNFVGRLVRENAGMLPQFGISFRNTTGELYIGSHNVDRITEPLRWFPVAHPDDGYWQVEVKAVRVGNSTIDECQGGCHGLVDTGAARLGVRRARLASMQEALASRQGKKDGICQGPNLEFDLGGMVLRLSPEDYADGACKALLGPLNLDEPKFAGLYVFGATVLRRYYTAFDWEAKRMGFASASADEALKPFGSSAVEGVVAHPLPETIFAF